MDKPRVLFLCVHNSARSQMAEGILRAWAGDRYDVSSAGVEATAVQPLAIEAMAEIGIDISQHTSKSVGLFREEPFFRAVTVCDDGKEACPFFPWADQQLHWSFEDPSAAEGTDGERMAVFRMVRDQIRARVESEFPRSDEP